MLFFILLVGTHICGDLLIYSPESSGNKRVKTILPRIRALGMHCLIHAFWVWIWLWPWDVHTKIQASLFIYIAHFIIDFIRPYIEMILIPKEHFVIFKAKKDVLLWLKGKADKNVTNFLDSYFYKWLFINVLDQGLHIASITICTWLLNGF